MVKVCQCCGKNDSIAVASSSIGAVSYAYCQECIDIGAEPYSAIVTTTWCVGGWNSLGESYKQSFLKMLDYHGKTMEDLEFDVKAADLEYQEYLRKCEEENDNESPGVAFGLVTPSRLNSMLGLDDK